MRSLLILIPLFATVAVAEAQEAEVEAAIRDHLSALLQGDFERLGEHYDANVRGFFLGGAALQKGMGVQALQLARDAGMSISLELRNLDVRVDGDVASSVGYVDGMIAIAGTETIEGTWRYSEVRVRLDGRWKVIQYHFSRFGSGAPGLGGPTSAREAGEGASEITTWKGRL